MKNVARPILCDHNGCKYTAKIKNLIKGGELYVVIEEGHPSGDMVQIGMSAWDQIVTRVNELREKTR